jgi:hypothetical protein
MTEMMTFEHSGWRLHFKCLVWGHDDHIRRAPGRMYLECWECGRETAGWHLRRWR